VSTPPAIGLLQILQGYRAAQAVYVAAKLGITDLIGEDAKSAEALAAVTGTHTPALRRLLRALASLGLFSRTTMAISVSRPWVPACAVACRARGDPPRSS
jgi:DNA-binding IclR family transcriptional regulator